MNDKISKLPKFKYHPNIYDKEKVLDGVRFDNNVCQCCGNKTDVYVSTMYCCENIDCICMECVANGKAAEKYDGEFIQDAEKISDEKKRDELFLQTPGYCSWQGEYWLACCDDYCAYLGTVGIKELEDLGIKEEVLREYALQQPSYPVNLVKEALYKDGDMTGYLFRCLHCGKYRLYVDAS